MKQLTASAIRSGMTYRCGGITGQGEFFLDLLNLPFRNNSVDLLYCCHVLNSLQDDRAAMKEVFRVLSPRGVALLQVPAFYHGATTLETNSLEERMATFHDEGIFRCYTDADYVARLQTAGFRVQHLLASELSSSLVQIHQLKSEVLHACFKQEPANT
jgi:SAM-dependent methyltransferase